MPSPLVSVIVPAFNADATLRESVASALNGSYKNIEVFIVDDGSTDSTGLVGEAIARSDDRAKLLRRENGGVSAAMNAGLAKASGEFVARLDADDLWHSEKLDRQVAAALQRPDVALLYTDVRYVNDRGQVVRDVAPQDFPERALCRGICESIVGGNSSALMRKETVSEAGGYDESLSSWEDLFLQLKISARYPIARVPGYLVGYRVRPGSLSARPGNMLSSWIIARERIKSTFPQIPSQVLDWANARRCADLAESFAWAGAWATTARLLREALRDDPERTTRFLAYRAARHIRNRFSKQTDTTPVRLFSECDPGKPIRLSEYDRSLEGNGLRELDERRAKALRQLDERRP